MVGVPSPGEIQFDDILRAEIEAINQRRHALVRPALNAEECVGPDGKALDAAGLALSGGGIRSAAFSLGVLQAFNHHNALRNVDYLSTVSGGGYMGSALTATMSCTQGAFVFGNAPTSDADEKAAEIADTDAVGHLRNYSNYLIPAGFRDIRTGSAIVLRGLVANFAWVLLIVLLAAGLTIITNPYRSSLGCPDLVGYELCIYIPAKNFGLTLAFGLIGLSGFFIWALYRSFLAADRLAEFRTILPEIASYYLIWLAVMFFVDLQVFTLEGMFQLAQAVKQSGGTLEWLTATVKTLAAIAAPVAAVVTFFRQQMGEYLKASNAEANLSTKIAAALSKTAFWIASAAVPLVVWVAYLYLSYWGIINDLAPATQYLPTSEARETVAQPAPPRPPPCRPDPKEPNEEDAAQGAHTPAWMLKLAAWVTEEGFCPVFRPLAVWENAPANAAWQPFNWTFERVLYRPMAFLYFASGFLLLLVALLLKPNANSLHGLYRDRLSKAFLFDPRRHEDETVKRNEPSIDQGRDFPQLDAMPVSTLSSRHAPYHLINTALNIQGSDYANRRGRNADFFLFSPCYVGSAATGYAVTADFERAARDLNVATAMAISGAAASSNMGSASIRPLRPTLALLNVRLGYWLKNPRYVDHPQPSGWWRMLRHRSSFFLLREIAGRLYENSDNVYLTDGGHIENLGAYELLRRRCKLIVVVDAEADFTVRFPSFITLQRYARIDLGVRIDMPWDDIRKTTCAWMGLSPASEDGKVKATEGPHAAIGTIDYGKGRTGHILYLKASLTGDENDYIRDYARRFVRFPHETTGDQFFSEEQFEVYRALGFHITHGVLCGRDAISAPGEPSNFDTPQNGDVKAVRAMLLES